MPTPVTNPEGEYYNQYRWTKRYDASVGGSYENFTLSAHVYNLLDQFAYYYPSLTNREHRSWRLFLEYALKF